MRDTAAASGRSLAEMRSARVDSVGRMPPDEQMTVMKAHYPRLVEARRQKAEHEALTGHSVHVHGWHVFSAGSRSEGACPENRDRTVS